MFSLCASSQLASEETTQGMHLYDFNCSTVPSFHILAALLPPRAQRCPPLSPDLFMGVQVVSLRHAISASPVGLLTVSAPARPTVSSESCDWVIHSTRFNPFPCMTPPFVAAPPSPVRSCRWVRIYVSPVWGRLPPKSPCQNSRGHYFKGRRRPLQPDATKPRGCIAGGGQAENIALK